MSKVKSLGLFLSLSLLLLAPLGCKKKVEEQAPPQPETVAPQVAPQPAAPATEATAPATAATAPAPATH